MKAAQVVVAVENARPAIGTKPAHIAYLTNAYPKVSHSFIRREIQALERQGVSVQRIALRGWDGELVDANDWLEREGTRYVLKTGVAGLLPDVLLANELASLAQVQLRTGLDDFTPAGTSFDTTRFPTGVALADMDGDGEADAVLPSSERVRETGGPETGTVAT